MCSLDRISLGAGLLPSRVGASTDEGGAWGKGLGREREKLVSRSFCPRLDLQNLPPKHLCNWYVYLNTTFTGSNSYHIHVRMIARDPNKTEFQRVTCGGSSRRFCLGVFKRGGFNRGWMGKTISRNVLVGIEYRS